MLFRSMLEEKCHIPVVGVAPYLQVEIEDEDSLTERFDNKRTVDLIDIAVIRTPRISNFTDFNPLEMIPGVSLRYVTSVNELKDPDMIILPGTKNTMGDLAWLRQNGLEAAILKAVANGKIIFGVCGGYQMLGDVLSDPHGTEEGGEMRGLGLIPIDTIFEKEKTRTRVTGHYSQVDGLLADISHVAFEGYEIHMGITTLKDGVKPLTQMQNLNTKDANRSDGAYANNVYGTYVHGIFDKEESAKAIITAIAKQKGINTEDMATMDFGKFKETQYDLLAEGLRAHLDMSAIYKILEEGL